jgi:hypothetical protein
MLDQDDVLRCHRCLRVRTVDELDRMLWCEECQVAERRRAGWLGRALGFAAAVALSVWIAIRKQPSEDFLILWALVVIVALYLLSRLGQELVFGIIRVRNVAGARAADDGARAGGSEAPDPRESR